MLKNSGAGNFLRIFKINSTKKIIENESKRIEMVDNCNDMPGNCY